jgi:sterol 3beta-glucosyltransferase
VQGYRKALRERWPSRYVAHVRIAVLTYGSRGDVDPFAILVRELIARGHDAWLCAPGPGGPELGVPLRPLVGDIRALLTSTPVLQALHEERGIDVARKLVDWEHSQSVALDDGVAAGCDGAERIVASIALAARAVSVAEHRRTPLAVALLAPTLPTSAFQSPLVEHAFAEGIAARATHDVVNEAHFRMGGADIDEFRMRLGLSPLGRPVLGHLRDVQTPVFSMHSPALLARPADWEPSWLVTGAMKPSPRVPNAVVDQFVAAGAAPFAVGFGSMPLLDPHETFRTVERALEEVDGRAVVAAGWSGLPLGSTKRMLVVEEVDHASVLPRCVGAVHHGGGGTTTAVVRAGLPAAIWSLYSDQHFWGRLVAQRGLGLHQRFAALDSDTLAAALRTLRDDDDLRAHVRAVAAQMASEDGAGEAIRTIELTTLVPRLS